MTDRKVENLNPPPPLQHKIKTDPFVRTASKFISGEIHTLEQAGKALRELLDGHSTLRDMRRKVREALCINWTEAQIRTVHSKAMRYLRMD